jgi:dTDP-4-dehydrorhamnose 3,5-epimerase
VNTGNPNITGLAALRPKHSAVDHDGQLKIERIAGMDFRPTRPVPHEDGHVIEIARAEWDIVTMPIVQVHMTTTLPGRVRAWGLHRGTIDRLFVARGLVRIACYDGREGSETYGRTSELTLSDRNPGLVVIGPNLYHGWKNIGTDEAIVINMPTQLYDHDQPDAFDLPWDSEDAQSLIPVIW